MDLAASVVATDELEINKSGVTKKATAAQIADYTHSKHLFYSDIHVHDNAVATVIDTANVAHFVQGLFGEVLSNGLTFAAGSTGAITAFADATGGQVTVTSAGHTLSNGDIVSISGTTNYNGVFTVDNVSGGNFEITDTWVADDATGNFYQGDNITVDVGSAGIYAMSMHLYGSSAIANKDFAFEVYKNNIDQDNIHAERRFATVDTGAVGSGGIVSLAEGDIISFAISNLNDTTNFTAKHINLTMHKL